MSYNVDINSNEMEKKELIRLLETAKDEDRKSIINKALAKIEDSELLPHENSEGRSSSYGYNSGKGKSHGNHQLSSSASTSEIFHSFSLKSPSSTSSLNSSNVHSLSGTGSGGYRPMSASPSKRRPSFLLDSIPENKEISLTSADKLYEQCIQSQDIISAVSSFSDCYPTMSSASSLLNLFNESSTHSGSSHGARNHISNDSNGMISGNNCFCSLVTTGLTPHFLFIRFRETWLVKRVEIECSGIQSVCFQMNSATSVADRETINSSNGVYGGVRNTGNTGMKLPHRNNSNDIGDNDISNKNTYTNVKLHQVRDGLFVYKTSPNMLATNIEEPMQSFPNGYGGSISSSGGVPYTNESSSSSFSHLKLEGNAMTVMITEVCYSFCVIQSVRTYGAPLRGQQQQPQQQQHVLLGAAILGNSPTVLHSSPNIAAVSTGTRK